MTTHTSVHELTVKPTVAAPTSDPLRLLHIEDNAADAELAQSYIRGVIPDVEFDTAARIADLTPLSVAAASCAILDLSLPDATGLEALEALRAMSADLPIIVLTGFDDLELGLSAIRHGAEDYLVKNFADGDSLQRAIRYAMERRRLSRALITQQHATQAVTRVREGSDTHQVSIEADADSGVFSARCQDCGWELSTESAVMSSLGVLERALIPHVAFGGSPYPARLSDDTAEDLPAPGSASPARTPRDGRPGSRQCSFAPGVWLG